MAKIRRKYDKGIRIKKENIEGAGGDDLTLDGEIGYDSDDENLKARLDGATRAVVTNDQAQTLENKTIDGTVATGNNTISADADNISYDNATSGLSATNVKAAIDELQTGLENQNEASEIDYDNATSGLVATTVQAAIDEVEGRVDTAESDITTNATNLSNHLADAVDAHDASAISYDNATSGLTATDAQAALDEIEGRVDTIEGASYVNSFNSRTGAVVPAASDYDANQIDYDNSTSGLIATDAQAAIDEVEGRLDTAESDITANQAHVAASSDVHGIGATADVVGTDTTQALTNKDIDGGTASDTSRITVPQDTKSNLDALTRKEGTVVYANDEDTLYVDDGTNLLPVGSGSGAGFKNYITNPDANLDLSNVTVYANSSASDRPDDFGGVASGNLTLTRNTTTPLAGAADFQISTTAANLQGEGVYWELDAIDKIDYASVLTAIIGKDASDSGLADGDYRWFIVSSNDSFVSDFNVQLLGDSAGSTNDDIFQFQSSPNSGISYRLCLHRAVTTATATDLYVDDVRVGPRETNLVASFGDWIEDPSGMVVDGTTSAPTPSTAATTSISKWRRVGNFAEVSIQYVTSSNAGAANGSGDYLFKMPGNLKIDTTQLEVNTTVEGSSSNYDLKGEAVGFGQAQVLAGEMLDGIVIPYDEDHVRLFGQVTSNSNLTRLGTLSSGAWNFATSFIRGIQLTFKVPIQGWELIPGGSIAGREIRVRAAGNGGSSVTSSTNIPFTTIEDTTGSWSGSVLTVPETGMYVFKGSIYKSSTSAASPYLYVDKGAGFAQELFLDHGAGTESIDPFSGMAFLEKGWQAAIRDTSISATLVSDTRFHYLNIQKLATPQTLLGNETVALRVSSNNGQNISSSVTTYIYEDISYDTHGSYNNGTGVYEIPVSGYYRITSSIESASNPMGTGDSLVIYLVKNGTDIARYRLLGNGTTQSFQVAVTSEEYFEKGDTLQVRTLNTAGAVSTATDVTRNYLVLSKVG